ncbi:MAG: hypothetical protein QXN23_00530 [Candidatus Caldarchaeum sp.]|uniref:DUF2029 domain-containing protein n=1 Tax=Caldiarchaeum subterraneum TaxID=311458 RepID=A0A7C4E3C4_CALS0|nr:hypothetical protein [Candidatus Caldarchaeales archaeon]MDJ0273148.1 hypothetical protein [Candidatus Caldarchaeales archaeon]
MWNWRTLAVFGAAFLIRAVLAPFFGHSWDMYVWVKSGEMFSSGVDIYSVKNLTDFPWGFYAYPPIWLYWLGFAHAVSGFFPSLSFQVFVIKLPIILSDLAVAVLISRLAAELGGLRYAGLASLLWLFNPLVIAISAVWGMFDSIAVALTLLGVLLAYRRKYAASAFVLGVGGAVKLYPLFLMLPLLVYMKPISLKKFLSTIIACVSGLIIPAAPYITNPVPLVEKLFYHFGNIGSFTYWTALSLISPPAAIPALSYGFFAAILYIIYRRTLRNDSPSLFDLSQLTLVAFLATSAKVNVQYVLWVLPFLTISSLRSASRELRMNTVLLVAAGLLFIAASQVALAIFDLRNLGRIVVSREVESMTIGGVALALSAIFGGSRFIVLLTSLIGVRRNVWNVQRITIASLLVVFVLVIAVFPVGRGVVMPRASVVVGVTEGVEALFTKTESFGLEAVADRFFMTHLVIPFGPEPYIYGGNFGESSRFKLTNDMWLENDLTNLASKLKTMGVKPVLGLYLKTSYVSVHFGYHGYNSSRLLSEFGRCVSPGGDIVFSCVTDSGEVFADFLAEKVVATVTRMGYVGVYVMGFDWISPNSDVDGFAQFISSLTSKAKNRGLLVFVEVDPVIARNGFSPAVENIMTHADYIVLLTNPFVKNLENPLQGNYTIAEYKRLIGMFAEKASGVAKVLYSLHVMDIAKGWMTPALQIQLEVNEFSSVKNVYGYAVYHVSRYLPMKLSVS